MESADTKRPRVARMFAGLVPVYDRMNRLISAGLDGRWRRVTVRGLERSAPLLDVGAGTGDLALAALAKGNPGPVLLLDVSREMLAAALAKAAARGCGGRVLAVVGDAEHLPLRGGSVGCVVSAFVLRNLDSPSRFFAESSRVLAPRGRMASLEIAHPPRRWLRRLFHAYFYGVMPVLARIATRRAGAYGYLAGSVRAFPPQDAVREDLDRSGFPGATFENLSGGVAAVYRGVRR
jgi:demethylmenaquinone methyltransferase/2-methoxy-6-polyprenyl-1,4-benzoquinol methylase